MIDQRGLRLVVAELALLAVTLVVALGFGRLFDDSGGWLWPLVAAAAMAHAVGAVLRRVGVGVALQVAATALGTLLVAAWTQAPDTLRFALPTAETLSELGAALDEALMLYPDARSPTEPVTGFVVAAMIGLVVVAAMADIAAFRLAAEIQALIPPFTLFVFCSVLGTGDDRILIAAAFAVTALAFMLIMRALSHAAAATWLPGDGDRGPVALIRLGGSLTAVAALAAVLVAPALPGADEEGLWTWRGGGGEGTRQIISPMVDIRSRLVEQSSEVAFTVESSEPSYWRMMALDEFDGQAFTFGGSFRPVSTTLLRTPPAGQTVVEQRFELEALASPYLPSAFVPVRIDADEDVQWDDRSSTLLLAREFAYRGLEYTVESMVDFPEPDQLRLAPDTVPPAIAEQHLALPELDPEVIALAESVTAAADNPYDRALALQEFFRSEFTYSVTVPEGHSESELASFLLDGRAGYCEQFSTAFAAMARVVGLPSRVAVGFTVGEQSRTDDNLYTVRGEHAHAWPEVWIGGAGWVPFEPTPGRGDPAAEGHTGVAGDQEGGLGPATTTTTTEADDRPTPTFDDTIPDIFGDLSEGGGNVPLDSPDEGVPTPLVVIGWAIVAIAGWILLVWGSARGRRWVRLRRAGVDPAGRVQVAWAEVVDVARAIKVTPTPSQTHREFATDLARRLAVDPAPLQELGERAAIARYAPDAIAGSDDADEAWQSARLVTAAIWSTRSRRQRLIDLIDLRLALPVRRTAKVRRRAGMTIWAR